MTSLVGTHEDGFKSISYLSVIPILTNAIKEQQVIIEDQESRLATLEVEMAEAKNALLLLLPLEEQRKLLTLAPRGGLPNKATDGWFANVLICSLLTVLTLLKLFEVAFK